VAGASLALLLLPPSPELGSLEPVALVVFSLLAILAGLLPGLAVLLVAMRRGAWAWLSAGLALVGALVGEEGTRLVLGLVRLEMNAWPVTSALWERLVHDFATGVFFVIFLGLFTVALDLALMAWQAIAMGFFLYGLILTVPAAFALTGALGGALVTWVGAWIARKRHGRTVA
jgi:hypothetical protein